MKIEYRKSFGKELKKIPEEQAVKILKVIESWEKITEFFKLTNFNLIRYPQ
jgi:mRNA-degrading endonuclease RelE of RelBE toxin-antitoxin system